MIHTGRCTSRLMLFVAAIGMAAVGCGGVTDVVSLKVTPASATIQVGQTQPLTVFGVRANGSEEEVPSATWSSSSPAIATVDGTGVVVGVADGLATITCNAAGHSATVSINVGGVATKTLSAIAIAPATVSLDTGKTQALTVNGAYSDGSMADVTAMATFASSASTVASVSSAGVVTGVLPGAATITATVSGKTATAAVTVTATTATLSSIAASPTSVTLTPGGTQAITVTASYSNSTTAPVTSSATFVSSDTTKATVSAAGLVTAVAVGSATITATYMGKTATVAVTISATAPTLVSIAVTPNPVSLAPAGTQQLTVTGTYSSGPTQDVTSKATFTSGTIAAATVSAGGLVTGVAVGSSTITAKVTPTGGTAISGTTTVNVAAVTTPAGGKVFYAGAYDTGVAFQPFGGSVNDVTVDATTTLNATGHGSLKVNFPASGSYTGGAFVDTSGPRNLTAFDSVTFWAKASAAITLDKVGLGNNGGFSANNGYDVEEDALAITTTWQKFIVPIPLAAKLTATDGLFHFADGTNHTPLTLWLADIQYEVLGSSVISAPVPTWSNSGITIANAATYQIQPSDLTIGYTVNSAPLTLTVPNTNYFTFTSDDAVATVSATGLVTGVNTGASTVANITAKLGTIATTNKLAVTVTNGVVSAPTTLPPVPTIPAGADVISLYSSVTGGYNGTASDKSANVDTWLTCWGAGSGGDPSGPITVGANTASPRKYVFTPSATYIGIEVLGK